MACSEPPLRRADLAWWRRWLAEPAILWLELVLPGRRRFTLTLFERERTLSEEVIELEAERKRERWLGRALDESERKRDEEGPNWP